MSTAEAGVIESSVRAGQVLVADDDACCRALTRHMLVKDGFEVIDAGSGHEALQLLDRITPGLILLDLDMPELSGFEVCQKIKENPRWADIPIIFLTAASDPEDKRKGFQAGGADYVTKPIEPIELLARIRCHLELAMSRRAIRRRAELFEMVATSQMDRLDQVRWGQTSMLTSPSAFPELKLGVKLTTALEAGGDFYEISRLNEEEYGFLVMDVSGHDLSIPYITGALKALAGLCLNETLQPRETMIMLNTGLRRILSEDRYVTGCCVRHSTNTGEVEIVCAGQPPVLHQSASGESTYINLVGDALGMHEQVFFEHRVLHVNPGDRLFVYTDGLIEGYVDEEGRTARSLFGMKEFKKRLAALPPMPVVEVVNSIVRDLVEQAGGQVSDDVILMGMEF